MRTLTATAERLLDDLPPYLRSDPHAQGYTLAFANEADRAWAMLNSLATKFLPHSADDEFRTLGMWERLLGLPVEPVGISEDDRSTKVVAFFRSRKAASGAKWLELLTTALGSGDWTHQEGPGDYEVTITIPFASGGYSAVAVESLLRKITPAHLVVNAQYAEGFIIGDSPGDPLGSKIGEDSI